VLLGSLLPVSVAALQGPSCICHVTKYVQGCTARDMEAVFRRGPDWEEGQELLMLLAASSVREGNGHEGFLQKLAELAELCGSLPVSFGPMCTAAWQKVGSATVRAHVNWLCRTQPLSCYVSLKCQSV